MRKLLFVKFNAHKIQVRKFYIVFLILLVSTLNGNSNRTVCYKNINTPQKKEVIIVIDAGHGGKDNGTQGHGINEKDITLKLALQLGAILARSDRSIKVIYTRTDDTFLALHKRVSIANKHEADLFISLHCNYVEESYVKGLESYVMGVSQETMDEAIANRENESILLESNSTNNYDGYIHDQHATHIILSSFQNAYLDKSIELARQLEKSIGPSGMLSSRGIKQAGFLVLRNANMPSILIESGFLSNRTESKNLASDLGQYELTNKIANAIYNYLDNLDK